MKQSRANRIGDSRKPVQGWRLTVLAKTLIAILAVTLSMLVAVVTRAGAADVLILGPTVTGFPPGTNSLEFKIVTGSTGVVIPGVGLTGLGMTADVVPATGTPPNWANPPQPYSAYKVIVLGDPLCTGTPGPGGPIAAAEANAAVWAAAVTGNVVIIGTDPTYHAGGLGERGAQLWKSAISFAAAGPGTGAVISLSCYYGGAVSPTPVAVLAGFGTFLTQQAACANNVAIVAASPALTGLTSSTLSNWSCSVHEGFTSWPNTGPTPFTPLAIATDSTVPPIFTAGDGIKGFPYILARGRDLAPVAGGILKICKVAGVGVAVGTSFTFTAGASTFTVPAGPGPGGTCVVGPTFPVGTTVTVDEVVPAGHVVSSISVAPPSQLVGTPNLAAGSVNIRIGSGVTEVTFTDKRTGFVEICKRGRVGGNFTFTVNPGALGPFVVPAQACSPAIEVAAGTVIIRESPTPGIAMVGCASIPAGNQLACNTVTQTSTVNVVPGSVSTMTIAFVDNRPTGLPTAVDSLATEPVRAVLACAPNPAPLRGPVTCTARVAAASPDKGSPTGAVMFMEGNRMLATAQLTAEGTATFLVSTLAAGSHAIVASYSGDERFESSVSQQFNLTIEPR